MPATFTLHEVAAGVWAAVAPGTAGPAVSNAAIVDLGDKTIVVDTFMTTQAAGELRDDVLQLTGREPFLVVNSHWHSDHVRGNRVFADQPIVGTRRMNELIVADAPQDRAEYASRVAAIRQSAKRLAAQATTDEERRTAAGTMALVAALESDADGYRLTLPDVLIGERLDIEGERSATVLGYGAGHTESDLFVHLPDAGAVVAGDLLWTGIHPKTDDGFPGPWADVLDRIAALGPTVVIPGHGAPGTAADLAVMAGYLRELERAVAAVRDGDLDADTAPVPEGSADWQGAARYRAGLNRLAASS